LGWRDELNHNKHMVAPAPAQLPFCRLRQAHRAEPVDPRRNDSMTESLIYYRKTRVWRRPFLFG